MGHCLLNMCSHTQGGQVRLAVPHLRTAQTTKVSRGAQKNVAVKADMPHFGVRGTMGAVQPAGVAVRSAPQLFDVGGALDRRHVLQLLLARGTGILVYLARRLAHATGAPRILALAGHARQEAGSPRCGYPQCARSPAPCTSARASSAGGLASTAVAAEMYW